MDALLKWVIGLVTLFFLWGAGLSIPGCAQEDKSHVRSDAKQDAVAPNTTKVNDATQGSQISVTNNFNYYPDKSKGGMDIASSQPTIMTPQTVDSQAVSNKASGAPLQIMDALTFNYTITTGGTTPTLSTGAQSASAAGTQNPQTNPVKDQRQDPTAAVPISIAMPLGQATTSGQAAGPNGVTSGAQTQTPTQKNGLTSQVAGGLNASNAAQTPIDGTAAPQSQTPTATVQPSPQPAVVQPQTGTVPPSAGHN